MMSTEHHKKSSGEGQLPQHENVSFEERDVRSAVILKFLAYLGGAIVLSYLLTLGIYHSLAGFWSSKYVPPPPSRGAVGSTIPPEPRLQGVPGHLSDPQQDLRDKVRADTEANKKLGWIDEQSGIAQIPVKDAMQLIVEKGLPAVTPPAETK
ncbi:MAG: hypothetical protein WBL63_01675 [Candidatus Acidiferrum sp.]